MGDEAIRRETKSVKQKRTEGHDLTIHDTGVAAEEGVQRVQLPTQTSDEGRLAFRQRDMQNGSYRVIFYVSANILNFTGGASKFWRGASL